MSLPLLLEIGTEEIPDWMIPNALETRAANASYDRGTDSYTLYVANQNPHVERLLMTAFVLGLSEHKVRVVAPDVGGGFGSAINGIRCRAHRWHLRGL